MTNMMTIQQRHDAYESVYRERNIEKNKTVNATYCTLKSAMGECKLRYCLYCGFSFDLTGLMNSPSILQYSHLIMTEHCKRHSL